MQKTRYGLIALSLLLCMATSATAQISIGIGLPGVSIGINLPLFPELVVVPGYPVYYAPQMDANYFFYDGMYWVYQDDNWYASSWYNGPWGLVEPEYVPLFILRVPVHYYRHPPVYFRGWRSDTPPRWGQHWGHGWEQRRSGWDRWSRRSAPAPAPLPVYQRQYSGDRYPRVEQQQTLRSQHYRYQPRETIVRQHFREQAGQRGPGPAQRGRQEAPQTRSLRQQEIQRSTPLQQGAPAGTRTQQQQRGPAIQDRRQQPVVAPGMQQAPRSQGEVQRPQQQRRGGENMQRPAPVKTMPQQPGPAIQDRRQQPMAAPRVQQAPRSQGEVQRPQPQHRGGENMQRPAPIQSPPQQRGPAVQGQQRRQPVAVPPVQQAPEPQGQVQRPQDSGKTQEPRGGQGQGPQKDEERGRGH